MRVIEEKILQNWSIRKPGKLSARDSIYLACVQGYNDSICYRLWNTNLVEKIGKTVYINLSGNMEERDRFYRPNPFSMWQPRDYIMSNTTKSRLNAFLNYYGFNYLEVHSSLKDWSIKYNGEKLEVDSWYKLNMEEKKLEKVEK